jgi:hypothetical protein
MAARAVAMTIEAANSIVTTRGDVTVAGVTINFFKTWRVFWNPNANKWHHVRNCFIDMKWLSNKVFITSVNHNPFITVNSYSFYWTCLRRLHQILTVGVFAAVSTVK